MASRKIEDCDIRLQNAFNATVDEWLDRYPDFVPFLTCTHRPNDEQDELYAQGRTKKGQIVTNAKGGESPHNFLPSQAIDVGFKTRGGTLSWSLSLFKTFATLMFKHDPTLIWGGDWNTIKDFPHFETPDWRQLK